jgi:nucleoside-diphosphate-sugar epimerase
MRVVITGGAGFIGQKLARALLRRGKLHNSQGQEQAISELVLFDQVATGIESENNISVTSVSGDIADPAAIKQLLGDATGSVFHLAAVVSAAAEADFELGMRVNFDGTRILLEACRQLPLTPRLIFTSSVAVFGGELPRLIRDDTYAVPQSSYGSQKVMGELLVNDYSRRGYIDGRAVRLPTIVVRPGKPNKAASSFASSIIREPLQGLAAVCPVPAETAMFILSPRRVIDALIHAHELDAAQLGKSRIINLAGLAVTVGEMIDALRRAGGESAAAHISWQDDPRIGAIVGSWPAYFETVRANTLGFVADRSIDEIVAAFIEDELQAK